LLELERGLLVERDVPERQLRKEFVLEFAVVGYRVMGDIPRDLEVQARRVPMVLEAMVMRMNLRVIGAKSHCLVSWSQHLATSSMINGFRGSAAVAGRVYAVAWSRQRSVSILAASAWSRRGGLR